MVKFNLGNQETKPLMELQSSRGIWTSFRQINFVQIRALVIKVWDSEKWYRDFWIKSSEDIGLRKLAYLFQNESKHFPNSGGHFIYISPKWQQMPHSGTVQDQGYYKCSVRKWSASVISSTCSPLQARADGRRGSYQAGIMDIHGNDGTRGST